MTDSENIKSEYLNNLDRTYIAYSYFNSTIPTETQFADGNEVVLGKFHFRKADDANSIRIDLGWAYFARLEAVLEAYTIKLGIKEKRKLLDILDYLKKHNVTIPLDFDRGLKEYREIRNTLHHGDGDVSLLNKPAKHIKIPDGEEIHLTPDHIKNFYELLKWLGDVLS